LNVRRGKPLIESVIISDDKREKINEILTSTFNSANRQSRLRELAGGFCIVCNGIPSKKAIYDMKGAKLIDYYCDNCFPTDIKKLK
jgi:hypothetical protein